MRPDRGALELAALSPYTQHMVSRGGAATAYVCQNFACELPTADVKQMMTSLGMAE